MKTVKTLLVVLAMVALAGCSSTPRSPDVTDDVRHSLDGAGLKNVSVSEDRDKGVVTLGGTVPTNDDRSRADSAAHSAAGPLVVANQIAVVPAVDSSDARAVNSDLDKGIEKNLDAALIQSNLKKAVSFDVKNGVVILTGNVNSEAGRARAQSVASSVPNVLQVVNELQVKDQKATTSY